MHAGDGPSKDQRTACSLPECVIPFLPEFEEENQGNIGSRNSNENRTYHMADRVCTVVIAY